MENKIRIALKIFTYLIEGASRVVEAVAENKRTELGTAATLESDWLSDRELVQELLMVGIGVMVMVRLMLPDGLWEGEAVELLLL